MVEMSREIEHIFGDSSKITVVRDPFQAQCITRISLVCHKNIFSKQYEYDAYIEFKNGNTEGEQKIKGTSLADLFFKVKDFCEGL